jgi:hypothetical protein
MLGSGKDMDLEDADYSVGVRIQYRGSEWTPDRKIQYASFTASGRCEGVYNTAGFYGSAEFEAPGETILEFARQLDTFRQDFFKSDFGGRAELVCGWGNEVSFAMKVSRLNARGHILLECTFRERYHDYYQCFQLFQTIEFAQIASIAQFFSRVPASEEKISLFIPAYT